MSEELQNYKIDEAKSQSKLNEAMIAALSIRIGNVENDCKNMQRTANMAETNRELISGCQERLNDYDSWRKALLWATGVAGLLIGYLTSVILSLLGKK